MRAATRAPSTGFSVWGLRRSPEKARKYANVESTPTLEQFKDACRHEFSFLRELGYSEVEDFEHADRFNVVFSNGELTLSVRGENWGQHAGVRFFHLDGREAPGFPSTRPGFLNSTTSVSSLSRFLATAETCWLATLRNSTR